MAKFKVGDKVANRSTIHQYINVILQVTIVDYEVKVLYDPNGSTTGQNATFAHNFIDNNYDLYTGAIPPGNTQTSSSPVTRYKVGDIVNNLYYDYEIIAIDATHYTLQPKKAGIGQQKELINVVEKYTKLGSINRSVAATQVNNAGVPGNVPQPSGPSAITNCKFKPGDTIQHPKGRVLKIVSITLPNYFVKVLNSNNSKYPVGLNYHSDITMTDTEYNLVPQATSPRGMRQQINNTGAAIAKANDMANKVSNNIQKDLKPCTCEMKTLMHYGCKCGAVKKYSMGMR